MTTPEENNTLAIETLNGTLTRIESLLGTLLERGATAPPTSVAVPTPEDNAAPVPDEEVEAATKPPTDEAPAETPAPPAKVKRKKRAAAPPEPKTVEVPAPVDPEEQLAAAPEAPAPEEKPISTEPPVTVSDLRGIVKATLLMGEGWSVSEFREWLSEKFGVTALDQIDDPARLGAVRDAVYAERDKAGN